MINNLRLVTGLAMAFSMLAPAQTSTGSITGTVADSAGQVIPAAAVTLINERTGEERNATTNDVGDFVFPALVPGPYTIKINSKGFRPLESKGNNVLSSGRNPFELILMV